MTDEAAFLLAVGQNPEDDAPRLVLCDWLDENGRGPEAAYIRAAVAASVSPACPRFDDFHVCDCPVCAALTSAETLGRRDWYAWPEAGEVHLLDRRGLPARARCNTATFLAHASALFAAHPTLTVIDLTDKRGSLGAWNRADPDRPGQRDGAPFTLPAVIWDLLSGGTLEPSPNRRTTYDRRVYPTETAAWNDLSRAAFSYGRRARRLGPES